MKRQNLVKLIKAITAKDIAETKRLITEVNDEETHAINKFCNTALHYAAFGGYKTVCELIISMNLEIINAIDYDGWTALHFGALGGHKEVCDMLINEMSQQVINVVDKNGNTALHVAAFEGNKEVCKLLISKMNSEIIDITNRGNWTALHLAAERSHKEICKVLIGNMRVKNSVKLLKQSSNDSPIQKAASEIVADFINDKFLGSKITLMDFTGYQIKLLKLYQTVNPNLLKLYLNEEKSINSANNYITKHYFTIIGVAKSVNEDSPMSMLVNSDCMPHMLSYLAPHSLCPELFAPVELSGEGVIISSGN
jgi:ankyrin repeat protein